MLKSGHYKTLVDNLLANTTHFNQFMKSEELEEHVKNRIIFFLALRCHQTHFKVFNRLAVQVNSNHVVVILI